MGGSTSAYNMNPTRRSEMRRSLESSLKHEDPEKSRWADCRTPESEMLDFSVIGPSRDAVGHDSFSWHG